MDAGAPVVEDEIIRDEGLPDVGINFGAVYDNAVAIGITLTGNPFYQRFIIEADISSYEVFPAR